MPGNVQNLFSDITGLLRDTPLFRHLLDDQLDLLNADQSTSDYRRGCIIYSEGSRIHGCYCILSGIVKIYKTGTDGKEQIIRFARAGDLIGFRSVISNELACTTAEVIEDTMLCYIPAHIFTELIKDNGNFAFELMRIACRELDEANTYLTDIAQKTVRERLAEVLVHLKNDFGSDDMNRLKILLTREELANIVGTATESVIRLISEFKQEGLIEVYGKKIKIVDEKALKKAGNLI